MNNIWILDLAMWLLLLFGGAIAAGYIGSVLKLLYLLITLSLKGTGNKISTIKRYKSINSVK